METHVFAAVLLAALLHAGWNAAVKVGLDPRATMLLLALVQAAIAALLLPFVPAPAMAALPWLAASALLHAGYKIFLTQAYRHADLNQVYPVARGAAPLLVAVFSVSALGETVSVVEAAAVAGISAGVLLMALKGGASGAMNARGLCFGLATAGFTASYTIVDGVGARLAGGPTGFVLWMALGDAGVMCLYAAATGGRTAFARLRPAWKSGLAAGAMSLASYWIAVWAFTQAPLALVAALRETSILFAVLISAFVLRERTSPWRWAAAAAIGLGVLAMRI